MIDSDEILIKSDEQVSQNWTLVQVECPKCKLFQEYEVESRGKTTLRCNNCNKKLLTIRNITGYIYVLSNKSLNDLFKIGFTNRNIDQRIKELSSMTSIPTEFNLELLFPAENAKKCEKLIHKALAKYRINPSREFFKTDLYNIAQIIQKIVECTPKVLPLHINSVNDLKQYSPWKIEKCLFHSVQQKVIRKDGNFYCVNCNSKLRPVVKSLSGSKEVCYECRKCSYVVSSSGEIIK